MTKDEKTKDDLSTQVAKIAPRLLVNKPSAARLTLARIMRAYLAKKIDATTYRNLVYGLSAMLAYFKFEADAVIEERLERIEEAIQNQSKIRDATWQFRDRSKT